MAVPTSKSYYDLIEIPRRTETRNIRNQLLRISLRDLSDLDFEALKAVVQETEQIVTAYGILMDKAAREAYDQLLPDINAHSIDPCTSFKDWAPGPETPISEFEKRNTRHRSEQQVQEFQKAAPQAEISNLEYTIQLGEISLREWLRLEVLRLKCNIPSYLGTLSRRLLRGMEMLGIKREKVRGELQQRDRHVLLMERLKLLLRTLETDLHRIIADPENAY